MHRQRLIILIATLVIFLGVAVLYVSRWVGFSRTHFRVGQIPPEITQQLLPKSVPLDSLHPPALRVGDPIRYGSATSELSVIEFGDFQCPYCQKQSTEIKQALQSYKGKVRFIWRDFPIEDAHPESMAAAIFARCAGQQGAFWGVYDALMGGAQLGERTYQDLAVRAGLNQATLKACRKDPAVEAAIRRDIEEARADGIQSAPLLFIGTKAFDGFIDAATLQKAIDSARASL